MHRLRLIGWLLVTACPGVPEVSPRCFDEPATLRVGQGLDSWQPLADGDRAEVIAGPQGGFHVWLAVRPSGVQPEVVVRVHVTDLDDDATLHDAAQEQVLEAGPARCTLEKTGLLVVLDVRSAQAVRGHATQWDVEVDDQRGHVATASAQLVLVPGP